MSDSTGRQPQSHALVDRIDRYQQQHTWAGFPFAVVKKFGEDQGTNLATLIAYYAFLSIFPLLLVLTTVLGYVLAGEPKWQDNVFSSVLGRFPIIGEHSSFEPLTGNAFALAIGLILAVWSGTKVAQTAQIAFNTVYAVPRRAWPGFAPRAVRSLVLLAVGGGGLIATTLLQGAVSGIGSSAVLNHTAVGALAAVVGILANFAVLTYLYHRLSVAPYGMREVMPGAAVSALAWFALQKIGTGLINGKIEGATGTYGTFAVVIGLLFWFYLLAVITLLCAEINVVRRERLWPRGLSSLSSTASTRADLRAYSLHMQREKQAYNIEIVPRFVMPGGDGVDVAGGAPTVDYTVTEPGAPEEPGTLDGVNGAEPAGSSGPLAEPPEADTRTEPRYRAR